MTEWLRLSNTDRLLILQQASARSGISSKAIEKDWWVTLVLLAVFGARYGEQFQFKGGTSLSKCWKLIERFSEDIDLGIDRKFLGFDEDLSKTQVKRLKRVAAAFTSNDLRSDIERKLYELGNRN